MSFANGQQFSRVHAVHPPLYRSHRPAGSPRPEVADGVNPLLQRHGRAPGSPIGGRSALSDAAGNLSDFWVHGMETGHGGPPRGFMPDSPVSFVNNIIAAIGQAGPSFSAMGGTGSAVHLHIDGGGRAGGLQLPRELQAVLGSSLREADHALRGNDRPQLVNFTPAATRTRWEEESKILYNHEFQEKAQRIINSLLRVLVPPAMEKKKQREQELQQKEEQAAKEREQRRIEREEAEKKELEKKEEEERQAAAEAEAEAEAEAAAREQAEHQGMADADDEGAMEGIESTEADASVTVEAGEEPTQSGEPGPSGPAEPAERVMTTFRGNQIDITDMGIDLAYLDALPDDIREEVLLSQLAIQRSQAASTGEQPTEISQEFLQALPPEIREELLRQEAQDRRRREREETRRQQAAAGGAPPRAEDMDPASFLASLDPTLRQHVLMEQDEEMLAHLPEDIVAEARALGGERSMHRFSGMPGRPRGIGLPHIQRTPQASHSLKKAPRKQIVQMLDKAGVATLLRLMFIPQHGNSRVSLNGILQDVAQNRQNRAEIVSLLLSVLQDGSADINAVERSFTQLSLRAKQTASQKTPQPLKRSLTGQMATMTNNLEVSPLMVIQQCLSALVFLTYSNNNIPIFFLTEHEVSSSVKSKSGRKGKGKETKASKYALNALLSLLDRKLIMESSGCMEQLASLLQRVTVPLNMLLKKDKEVVEEPKKIETPSDQVAVPAANVEDNDNAEQGESAEAVEAQESNGADNTSPMSGVQVSNEAENETAEESRQATTENAADETPKAEEPKKPNDEELSKRARTITPPVVPDEHLRLVVNMLAARECTSKTFRDTLSTINNLSAIPEAKEIFGKALVEKAQDLGHSISDDLDELVQQVKQAKSAADLQGAALAKFSPASSDQSKLLRVLTALDYLFDPKRNGGKTKSSAEDNGSGDSSSSKDDILTSLYENPTFGPLWDKLSECLSSIRKREGMLNIATILLPLVESLMVVCKNTTLKDAPIIKAARDFAITSPPPESRMESLFFKFTEEHRKILNDLVRHNPKLMSGTFSLLVKNPKVLEFDNKRNYFTRRLHARNTEERRPQPPLQLNIRRNDIFLDSFKNLHYKSGDEIKYGKLNIRFHGEEGVDAGGVTREWFQSLSRQMFNPGYALFIPVASDRTTFHPNKLSKVNEEHLTFFKFIGRIIGKALYEGRALDCHFSRALYKRILGKTVSIKDMETLDLDYYKSLIWMLENDIAEIITETMSVETDDFGVDEIVDLVPNGRNIPVTEENKQEYVQLVVEYRLTGSVETQLEHFLRGMSSYCELLVD